MWDRTWTWPQPSSVKTKWEKFVLTLRQIVANSSVIPQQTWSEKAKRRREERAEGKKSECLIVALHWTRSIDVNKWPEGHCMASPWRGNKQTKQQQRRRRQHQIGKSKLHVLHGRRWTRSSSSFSSGSDPVAFLVSRKFTAASHPFCLGSLCVASSALFVYFSLSLLSLLLYRNFICWRIFHRLVRWQQLARISPCIRASSSTSRLARECGN